MEIQSFQPVNFEELHGAPEALRDLVERYNRQIDSLTTALQNNLTTAENENSEIIEIDLEHGEETTLSLRKLKGRPVSAWLVWTDHFDTASFAWEVIDQTQVSVMVRWNSDPLSATTVRILFRGA